jgi:hypothetical protein
MTIFVSQIVAPDRRREFPFFAEPETRYSINLTADAVLERVITAVRPRLKTR